MSKGVRIGIAAGLLACLLVALAIPDVRGRLLDPFFAEPVIDGRRASEWARELYDPDRETRQKAESELDLADDTAWSRNLRHADPHVRLWANQQALKRHLDPEGKDRTTQDAVWALCECLQDPDPIVRRVAARYLKDVSTGALTGGKNQERVVSALAEGLHDKEHFVRSDIAVLLARPSLAPKAVAAVPALAEALRDSELGVRLNAARALGEMGPAAREAAPALKQAAKKDPSDRVRALAGQVLKKVDPSK